MRNIIFESDGVGRIQVNSNTHGNKEILIDIVDWELMLPYRWCVYKDKRTFYAQTSVPRSEGGRKTLKIHHLILPTAPPLVIDHINGNGLDNRRANLRQVTQQQNNYNFHHAKGYYWHKSANKWYAQIWIDGVNHYLGHFDTEAEASDAYQAAKTIRDLEAGL